MACRNRHAQGHVAYACIGIHMDMCIGLYVDMCIGMCNGICIGMCMDRNVYG